MGADRWSVCPNCSEKNEQEVREVEQVLADSYGEVGIDAWLEMREVVQERKNAIIPDTFREDYYIQTPISGEDSVYLEYSGYCTKCNFRVEFTHDHPFELP